MKSREKRIISGNGRFLDDLQFPNMAHLAFVGSTHAHAEILGIDACEAMKIPGVLQVITGEQMKASIRPMPPHARLDELVELFGWTWRNPTVYPLAVDKVRFTESP